MIKLGTYEDTDRLVEYGSRFWDQTAWKQQGIDYDVRTVTDMTDHLIGNGLVLYAEDAGKVVALMLIVVFPFPMNFNYQQATEWVFYVDPEYRKGGLGAELIIKAGEILKEKGVTFFSMISLTNVTPDAANRLYEHLGFEHSETTYTKAL